ncbi:hypothetical protein O6P43_030733 [Quillaja saponaria]|uniref:Uncharacterized protein n=1 Tax=Quillaja saponaria TaxID=32244 RepID=A0AAD7KVK0_QUISA|nr:hypothetical protein O6P43_030733 [Quillaja saponaria]
MSWPFGTSCARGLKQMGKSWKHYWHWHCATGQGTGLELVDEIGIECEQLELELGHEPAHSALVQSPEPVGQTAENDQRSETHLVFEAVTEREGLVIHRHRLRNCPRISKKGTMPQHSLLDCYYSLIMPPSNKDLTRTRRNLR